MYLFIYLFILPSIVLFIFFVNQSVYLGMQVTDDSAVYLY